MLPPHSQTSRPVSQRQTSRPLEPDFDSSGLCLLESQHAADFRMGWTRHPFFKVITALRGRGYIRTPTGESWEICSGRVVMIPSNVEHLLTDHEEEPLLIYILCVGRAFPIPIPIPLELRLIQDPAAAGRALRILREIAAHSSNSEIRDSGNSCANLRDLMRCGLTAILLGHLLGEPAGGGEFPDSRTRVSGFLSRLHSEFFLSRSTDEAAAELHMSRRRFTQIFRELAGESYAARVQRLRIQQACRMLDSKTSSPLTVAFETGFAEPSTFYRQFKRLTGLSPARWAAREGKNPKSG
jgi:AraC family L-rhamnose operon regulatory protein RhaS